MSILTLPSYPIMFIAAEDEFMETAMMCCCGEIFDEEIADSCPNCHGMPGITAKQHVIALTEIQMHLCELQTSKKINMAPCAGWVKWELFRLTKLLIHANSAANPRIPTQAKIDRLVNALQDGGLASASVLCDREHQEDECRAQWMEMGPFKMFPLGRFTPRGDRSA